MRIASGWQVKNQCKNSGFHVATDPRLSQVHWAMTCERGSQFLDSNAYEKPDLTTRDPLRLFKPIKDYILRVPIEYSFS